MKTEDGICHVVNFLKSIPLIFVDFVPLTSIALHDNKQKESYGSLVRVLSGVVEVKEHN